MSESAYALHYLKKNIPPFNSLSIASIDQLIQASRFFFLLPDENLGLQMEEHDRLAVIDGRINCRNEQGAIITLAKDSVLFCHQKGSFELNVIEPTKFCHFNGHMLDKYISISALHKDLPANPDIDLEQIIRVSGYKVFSQFNLESLINVIAKFERREVEAGSNIIEQNQKGDNFYILESGLAEVWRQDLNDQEQKLVAILGPGDSFGEEALITDGWRNATIRMVEDGKLHVLKQSDFNDLVLKPLSSSVSVDEAQTLSENGALVLDVRYVEEVQERSVPDAIHIPLPELRGQADTLDKKEHYLLLCTSGIRASAAAMILRQRGFKADTIVGGINALPED